MKIIHLQGQLGNQMFQYAFYSMLKNRGIKCKIYKENSVFIYKNYELDLFPNINIEFTGKFYKYISPIMWTEKSQLSVPKKIFKKIIWGTVRVFRLIYTEPTNKTDISDLRLINVGFFQNEKHYRNMENQLIRDFTFPNGEEKLHTIANQIKEYPNSVSIHIRRGDYLKDGIKEIFENICTIDYYQKAISLVSDENTKFYVFSNDINWVKINLKLENAVYINSEMFDDYHNWYDMYLMSLCKNNIIANSTFSWWGAYLNRNKDKSIVAPKKWMNKTENVVFIEEDICPANWIRI